MHRVCGIIHTDLKPENVVFTLTERQRFELLYENVLQTSLIDLFETTTPIILNKKQLANQKKKERKKKKTNVKKGEEEEGDKDEEAQAKQSKTQTIVNEFIQKIGIDEAKYDIVPEMQRERANSVHVERKGKALLDDDYIVIHPLKKNRKYIRVNSVPRLPSQKEYRHEMIPLNSHEVSKMKEADSCLKIVDMGNACYIEKHYSDIIQTREYRSPEVILGGEYDQTADIWSLACMLFELITGDYLFDPKKGKTYRKNDDHLALMTELIGPCLDKNFMQSQSKVWKFYNKKGMKLKYITKMKSWPLYNVLLEKYRLKDAEARSLADFLGCMLKWKPKDRWSARKLLEHPWLKETDDYNVWMSKEHLHEFKMVNIKKFPGYLEELAKKEEEEQRKAQKAQIKKLQKEQKVLEKKQKNGDSKDKSESTLEIQSSSSSESSSSGRKEESQSQKEKTEESESKSEANKDGEESKEDEEESSVSSPYESGKTDQESSSGGSSGSSGGSVKDENEEEWESASDDKKGK